jgi:hypothetical protein
VPDGAMALLVGVGDVQGSVFTIPKNVQVSLNYVTPDGEQHGIHVTSDTPDASTLVRGAEGLTSFVQNSPRSGKWRLRISTIEPSSFSVNVAIFRRPLQTLRAFAASHRCKACTVAVRALLWAALSHLTAGAAAVFNLQGLAAAIATLPTAILNALGSVFGISPDVLSGVIQGALDVSEVVSPMDRLVRAICERLNLCPHQAALVATT